MPWGWWWEDECLGDGGGKVSALGDGGGKVSALGDGGGKMSALGMVVGR